MKSLCTVLLAHIIKVVCGQIFVMLLLLISALALALLFDVTVDIPLNATNDWFFAHTISIAGMAPVLGSALVFIGTIYKVVVRVYGVVDNCLK